MQLNRSEPLLQHLIHSIWIDLFPAAWSSFSPSVQHAIVAALNKFLAFDIHTFQTSISTYALWEDIDKEFKPWALSQASTTLPFTTQSPSLYGTLPVTTSLQAILEALVRCSPQPRLPPVLLLHLVKSYGCGQQATLLMERGWREARVDAEKRAYEQCLKEALVGWMGMQAYLLNTY